MKPTRNLIMGAAWDTELEPLEPFVYSALRHAKTADIVLFVEGVPRPDVLRLRSLGIVTVQAPAFDRTKVSGNGLRYQWFLSYLTQQPFYANVMTTDVRDVIFQKDPFTYNGRCSDCLHVFLEEDKSIEECPWNSGWVEVIYGKEQFDAIKNNPISCSGVTYGPFKQMHDYIVLMTTHLNNTTVKLGGIDQGVHNYLLWNNLLPHPTSINENGKSAVLTMGYMAGNHMMLGEDLINHRQYDVPAVVHQYDRAQLGPLMRKVHVVEQSESA